MQELHIAGAAEPVVVKLEYVFGSSSPMYVNTECAIFPHLEAAKCASQEGVRSAAFSGRATALPLFE
jgi:hypothetical protein